MEMKEKDFFIEMAKVKIKLNEWGNSQGIRIPKDILKLVDFENIEELSLTVVKDEFGKKKLMIEQSENKEELIKIVESLGGILSDMNEAIDIHDLRKERKEERLRKYESLN
ncbi:hypothetical protein I6N95_21290 [Vagococcus sp. BWB3-3]|uniref:SpoVT-AbrB domain-containing protein n=1 Tax=Vagococcus allomyrinae TaxID=2794353 RepID=A0A940P8C2_9ENTE|nr:hypothetical protein [Vagococcus allomyrinae]MBP1043564.1 hypothetical protein [Vagococcus allomyrinae]